MPRLLPPGQNPLLQTVAGQAQISQKLRAQTQIAQVTEQAKQQTAKFIQEAKNKQAILQNALENIPKVKNVKSLMFLVNQAKGVVGDKLPSINITEENAKKFQAFVADVNTLRQTNPVAAKKMFDQGLADFGQFTENLNPIKEQIGASGLANAANLKGFADQNPNVQGSGIGNAINQNLALSTQGQDVLAKELQGQKAATSVFSNIDPKDLTAESRKKVAKTNNIGDAVFRPEALKQKIAGKNPFAAEQSLRKEFITLSKPFRDVRDSFARIQASSKDPSAAGDLSLIFNFMKMLDPNSVVRESEFATAANSAGVPDRVRNVYNKILTGERLPVETRKDFVSRAGDLMGRQNAQQDRRVNSFKKIATDSGLNVDNVVINLADPLAQSGDNNITPQTSSGAVRRFNPATGKIE